MKSEVVKAFIARYQITPQQSAALRRSNSIDKEFFDALTRVKRIHDDCKVLVQNHQTAGLQIMESMALQQESGYECLYRWCQVRWYFKEYLAFTTFKRSKFCVFVVEKSLTFDWQLRRFIVT